MNSPTFLVTGATDGIGKATARALAARGARVILHGRNPGKLEATLGQLRAATGNGSLHGVLADFASLAEVAALGERVRTDYPGLTVLINNAGLLTDHWQRSADGFEMSFAVNYLAPFLLTNSLLDYPPGQRAGAHRQCRVHGAGWRRVDFGNLQLAAAFDGWQAYANTKLMNVLFSHHLAGLLAGSGVVSNALCPGLIDTNFFHTNTLFAGGGYERLKPGMRSPEEGALVPLYLATDPAAGGTSGAFFVREGRDGRRAVPLAWDRAGAAALWAQSVDAVGRWLPPGMS